MSSKFNHFTGTDKYVASSALCDIVNVAINLGRPLLVKGEPGTGKTLLAHNIAKGLNKRLLVWNIKSTTKAKDGLYIYDTVQRLNDSRFCSGDEVRDISRYIQLGQLGRSFISQEQVVLLIDEIDKADLEFPNDLLNELEEMRFYIPETDELIEANHRPIVVITSNSEKELPDAFLRRCIFQYIEFPDVELMKSIIRVHFPNLVEILLKEVLIRFYWLRDIDNLRKKPSTSELIDWITALIAGEIKPELLANEIPFVGTLIKKERDMDVLYEVLETRMGSSLNKRKNSNRGIFCF